VERDDIEAALARLLQQVAEVDDAAAQPVELRHDDAADPARAAGCERGAQAGPFERLTAERVLLDPDQLPAPSLAFRADGRALRLEPDAVRALLLGRNAGIADHSLAGSHDGILYKQVGFYTT